MTTTLRLVCSWCGRLMREGIDPTDSRVSHGMCPACDQLSDAARDLLAEQRVRERAVEELRQPLIQSLAELVGQDVEVTTVVTMRRRVA